MGPLNSDCEGSRQQGNGGDPSRAIMILAHATVGQLEFQGQWNNAPRPWQFFQITEEGKGMHRSTSEWMHTTI